MNYVLIWGPVLIGLAFLVATSWVVSLYRGQSFALSFSQGASRFFREAAKDPLGAIQACAGWTMLLWIAGVGLVEFGLMLWLIHYKFKADFIEWIFNLFS
jgi:hypothetical protein